MEVKVKKLHIDAVIPKYAKVGDAGLDLTAVSLNMSPDQIIYDTGLAFEIPEGHVGLIFPRSSICKHSLSLANSIGVIDSQYRGPVKVVFNLRPNVPKPAYEVGDRICQLVILPYPQIKLVESNELSDTERGSGGFGSSGT